MTDRYGLAIGLPMATAILLKKQVQYRYSHGIGMGSSEVFIYCLAEMDFPGIYEIESTLYLKQKGKKKKKRT